MGAVEVEVFLAVDFLILRVLTGVLFSSLESEVAAAAFALAEARRFVLVDGMMDDDGGRVGRR